MTQEPNDTEEVEVEYIDGHDDSITDDWISEPEEEYLQGLSACNQ